jgi:peptidoglycan hydrolase-like protein with peptidoglycan-binding domain
VAALHKLQREATAGRGRPDLARAPRMGALVIFDTPGRSRAVSAEEEDARTYVGSSGIPQPPGPTEGTTLSSATHLRTRIMAVAGAAVLLAAGIWTALATTSAGAIPRSGHAGPEKVRSRTAAYSTARLDELLAQLGYLPLTWTPSAGQTVPAAKDAAGQLAAARNAPRGQFTWKPGYPAELRRFWRDGTTRGLILPGAVMAFEQQHGLKADGIAGPGVWDALLTAVADHDVNKNGYTYAVASEGDPETLTIWHNGQQVLQTDANTGIPASPTTIGTSPVYLKHYYQDMKGTNPNGTPYSSPVYYVSYFRGNLAVHWYPRTSYGFPQSLGCVELPWNVAKTAWQYLSYGTLVTVQPGSQTPSTSPVDPTT